jgi:predicted acetyltransferase
VTFLSKAADGIVPGEIVRLDASRADEILDLESIVWSSRFPPELNRMNLESLDFSWAIGVQVPGAGGGRLAAFASAFSFDTPVPGGRVAVAGLTWVSVRPEFRRRGYLRALMARHFEDCREREVPVSMLFASKMAIYGRFGYGLGSVGARLRLPRGAALRELPGPAPEVELRFETASFEAHDGFVEAVDRQAGHGPAARPGWTGLVTPGLRQLLFVDEPPSDPRLERGRILMAWREGRPSGYALIRRDDGWEDGKPVGTATVRAFQAVDPASAHRMWRALLDLDLITTVVTPGLAPDDPLLQWLDEWRDARPLLIDGEHVRLVDLPAALEARRYAAPVDLRLAVRDRLLGHNQAVWRLEGGPDGAQATKASDFAADAADVVLDVRDLGSLYLGGRSAVSLADAGLLAERTPGAAASLARALRSDRDPGTAHIF